MKNFKKMTEDELFESRCDASHEIADLTRVLVDIQAKIVALSGTLDKIDIEFEFRESRDLKTQNKLN